MSSTRDDIVHDCNKDILIDNVNDTIVTLAEAVVWLIPLTVADLDATGVVAGFGITLTPTIIQLGSCQTETESLQVIQYEENLGDTEQNELRSKQIYHSGVDC